MQIRPEMIFRVGRSPRSRSSSSSCRHQGSYLIWIACAAAIMSVATFSFDPPPTTPLMIFIASSQAACIVGFFVCRRLMAAKSDVPTLN